MAWQPAGVSASVWRGGCRASPGSWVKCIPVGTQVLRAALALCLFLSQELASGDGQGRLFITQSRPEDEGQSFLSPCRPYAHRPRTLPRTAQG